MDKKLDERNKNVWNEECENLLAEWSEKASCYRWLHGRSEKNYRTWYYCFSIPVIILSTLTGAANVGMDSFVPAEGKSMASAIVGGVNIFAGIISTLQNFLKVAELMEGHRIAGVSWGKLQRNIAIELALDPSRRVLQGDFLKLARAEYDRLIEAGPLIDDAIISSFNKKFKNYEVSVPSICNGLDKCNIYKKDKNIPMKIDEFLDGIEDVVSAEEKNIENSKTMQDIKIVKVNDKKDDDDSDIKIVVKEEEVNSLVNKDIDLEDINKEENIEGKEDDDMDSVRESEECSCKKNEVEPEPEPEPEVNDDEELLPEQNKEITDFLDGISSETK
jgi:hypothetical protein